MAGDLGVETLQSLAMATKFPCSWQILPQKTAILSDDYLLDSVIGRGTFGVVRKGINRMSGDLAAIKIVAKTKLSTPDDVDDLRQEVEIMQSLPSHGNIVELLDVYEDENALYLVLELCKGGDLLDLLNSPDLASVGGFSEQEAAEIFYQIAEAVSHCVDNGVMHRDVKPENICLVEPFVFDSCTGRYPKNPSAGICGSKQSMKFTGMFSQLKSAVENSENPGSISVEDRAEFMVRRSCSQGEPSRRERGDRETRKPTKVKLGDWGLAVRVREGEMFDGMAGSDPYLCPEMILEELYGIEADIWSLGVLLFTLLSRKLPFGVSGETADSAESFQRVNCGRMGYEENGDSDKNELFATICRGKLDFDSAPWPSISDEAKDLIAQMLSVDKHMRPKARDILKHPWMRDARASLRPDLVYTLTREPFVVPLSELRRRSYEHLPGLACLSSNTHLLKKGFSMKASYRTTVTVSALGVNTGYGIDGPDTLKPLEPAEILSSPMSFSSPKNLVQSELQTIPSYESLRSKNSSLLSRCLEPSEPSVSPESSSCSPSKVPKGFVFPGILESAKPSEPSLPLLSSGDSWVLRGSSLTANGNVTPNKSLTSLATCRGELTPALKDSSVSRIGSTLRLHDFCLNYRTLRA